MSTDLVVLNNAEALQPSNWDAKVFQVRPASLELVQRMSKSTSDGAIVGHFFDKKTGTNLERLTVVLAALPQDNRVLMPPGEFGAKPICKSRDGITPVLGDDRLMPQSPTCSPVLDKSTGKMTKGCDHSSWAKWHAGGKQRKDIPGCRQQVDFVFVERVTKLPFRMNVHGTSLKPFREKMEGVSRLAKVLMAQGKDPQPYWFSMELYPVERSNSKGSWFELGISNIKKLDDDAIVDFEKAFKDIMTNRLKIQTQEDDIEGEIINGSSNEVSAPAEA